MYVSLFINIFFISLKQAETAQYYNAFSYFIGFFTVPVPSREKHKMPFYQDNMEAASARLEIFNKELIPKCQMDLLHNQGFDTRVSYPSFLSCLIFWKNFFIYCDFF
jgi:hypothetical protein